MIEQADYIIVGAGSAGCVLAGRLAKMKIPPYCFWKRVVKTKICLFICRRVIRSLCRRAMTKITGLKLRPSPISAGGRCTGRAAAAGGLIVDQCDGLYSRQCL